MILIFDCETNGLNLYSDQIIQLAWALFDENGNLIRKKNFYIKGCELSHHNIEKCGITQDMIDLQGSDKSFVVNQFLNDLKECSILVAHNITFDLGFVNALSPEIEAEAKRCSKICTMKTTTIFVGINKFYGYKYPSLQELYYKIFNENFENAHNAEADVAATAKCFFYLKNNDIGLF